MTSEERLRPEPAWASRTGLVDLTATPDRPPADVRGRLEERIHRYCWGFDERRVDVLADCFTPGGTWRGDVMGETPIGPFEGRDAVVAWLSGFWPHQRDQRRHLFVNFVVEQYRPGSATGLAYLLLMGSSDGTSRLETTGVYRFGFRLQDDGEWRFDELVAGFDAPFWKRPVATMRPEVRQRFGVLGPTDEPAVDG